jgi:hypothetical protein
LLKWVPFERVLTGAAYPHKIDAAIVLTAPSFNGRTADSGSAYRGSNPWGAAKSNPVDLSFLPQHRAENPVQQQQERNLVKGLKLRASANFSFHAFRITCMDVASDQPAVLESTVSKSTERQYVGPLMFNRELSSALVTWKALPTTDGGDR